MLILFTATWSFAIGLCCHLSRSCLCWLSDNCPEIEIIISSYYFIYQSSTEKDQEGHKKQQFHLAAPSKVCSGTLGDEAPNGISTPLSQNSHGRMLKRQKE